MDKLILRGAFSNVGNNSTLKHQLSRCFYDYFTTLEDEVTFVWRRPKGMGTVLYLSTRYPAFIDLSLSFYHIITPGLSRQQCMICLRSRLSYQRKFERLRQRMVQRGKRITTNDMVEKPSVTAVGEPERGTTQYPAIALIRPPVHRHYRGGGVLRAAMIFRMNFT
ncbi:hypothetical protein BDN71DRAFT_191757 [Pleurotus eryngii]|uniref:DUF6533 domain-containing protein n=1 Tax=Pleurotus eryngii TaxID=5323 RepID=A0A9P5ZLE7_PLEER|nr:hypothetical protein BDN71DRAFT_191757 [Pleurotus eryngii]